MEELIEAIDQAMMDNKKNITIGAYGYCDPITVDLLLDEEEFNTTLFNTLRNMCCEAKEVSENVYEIYWF